jgi:hypothetical protein
MRVIALIVCAFAAVSPLSRNSRTTVDHRLRPINLTKAREPVEHCKVDQLPNAPGLAGHVTVANRSCPNHSPVLEGAFPGGSRCKGQNKIPVKQARSDNRGLPPFGLRGESGNSGWIRFHNGSGSKGALVEFESVHWRVPLPKNVRLSSQWVLLGALNQLIGRAGVSKEGTEIKSTLVACTGPR